MVVVELHEHYERQRAALRGHRFVSGYLSLGIFGYTRVVLHIRDHLGVRALHPHGRRVRSVPVAARQICYLLICSPFIEIDIRVREEILHFRARIRRNGIRFKVVLGYGYLMSEGRIAGRVHTRLLIG